MKTIITFIMTLFVFTAISNAQFQSMQNGDWNDPQTWSTDPNATALPDSTTSVIISHSVLVQSQYNISYYPHCYDLTIDSSGTLNNYEGGYTSGDLVVHNNLYNHGIISPSYEMRLTVKGNLYNYGSLLKQALNYGFLNIYIFGNLKNYGSFRASQTGGTSSDTYGIRFKGNNPHHIQTYNDSAIYVAGITVEDTLGYIIVDSLASLSAIINLNGSKIVLPPENLYPNILEFDGAQIDGGKIEANQNMIRTKNNSLNYLGDYVHTRPSLILQDVSTLEGRYLIGGINYNPSYPNSNQVIIRGETNFSGVFTDWYTGGLYSGDRYLFIEGDFTNNGNIHDANSGSGYGLFVNISGNLIHNGNLANKQTNINGNQNQDILIPGDSLITGKVVLDAILTGASYQWQKDGVDISGANSQTLNFNSGLNTSNYGLYQCIVDGNPSRKILINNSLPPAFEIFDVVIKNLDSTTAMVMWKTSVPATGFIFYAENDTTSGFPMEAEETNGLTTEHTLILDNLTTGSTYYFIIDENDSDWNNIRSGTYSFVAGDLTLGALSIKSIVDVPEDQGGWVYINFNADILDVIGDIKLYGIWEWMNNDWVSLGSVPATQDSAYTFLAHTYADSNANGLTWSKFYISAHTTDPLIYFNSQPDSGYSVDNIAPAVPEGLLAEPATDGSVVTLTWNRNTENDFAYYKIFRNNEEYATTVDTVFIDNEVIEGNYSYKIQACDANGNLSDFSSTVNVLVGVDDQNELPTKYSLSQNYPNPFSAKGVPTTTIKYAIPVVETRHALSVQLTVYDMLGRKVATLVNKNQTPGRYSVKFNANKLSTGIYFYILRAGDFSATKKMILLK